MEDKNLDTLFASLQGKFDTKLPNEDHELRFIAKLNKNKEQLVLNNKQSRNGIIWKSFLAIAASIIICFFAVNSLQDQSETIDLADLSPEMSETQDFFTVTIAEELKKLNKARSPLTKKIIDDALRDIALLETDYQNLKLDLTENGKDQRIIYAMISNFQSRIDILQTVIDDIETIEQLKNFTNETTNRL